MRPLSAAPISVRTTNLMQAIALTSLAGAAVSGLVLAAGLGTGMALMAGWLGAPVLACGALAFFTREPSLPPLYHAPIGMPGQVRLVVDNVERADGDPEAMIARSILDWEEDRVADFAAFVRARYPDDRHPYDDTPRPAA